MEEKVRQNNEDVDSGELKPILKWVGGKRQLLPQIRELVPKEYSCYCEPFVGGGAVLFDLKPAKAIINDNNADLIGLYKTMKDHADELIEELESGMYQNDPDVYYHIRGLDRDQDKFAILSDVEKAARIIYLNKTCFNGLYRVNSNGYFNVPFGKYKNPNILDKATIKAISKFFNDVNVDILNGDFADAMTLVSEGGFVYLDPPYDPITETSNFTSYTKDGFGKDEQKRLKAECDALNEKGIKFLQSNSATDFIRELYSDYNIKTVKAKRNINSQGDKRGAVDEILIYN